MKDKTLVHIADAVESIKDGNQHDDTDWGDAPSYYDLIYMSIVSAIATELDIDTEAAEKLIDQRLSERSEQMMQPKSPATFTFEFDATTDPRKGFPYVAKLTGIDSEGKFEREFFELERTYGKKEVTVSGKYTVKEGDLLEIRTGGSWKNDYRGYYLVHGGKEIHLGDTSESRVTAQVKKFLRGDITAKGFSAIAKLEAQADD